MTRLRWLGAGASFLSAIGVTALGYRMAQPPDAYGGAGSVWYEIRAALRDDGYGITVFCLALLVIGALVQAPIAARRGARVRPGLAVLPGLLGYLLLVAWLATLLAGPATRQPEGPGWLDPTAMYGVVLVCLLGGPALVAVSGAIFRPRDADTGLGGLLGGTALISGLLGGGSLLLCAAALATRSDALDGWLPDGGLPFLVLGALVVPVALVFAVSTALTGDTPCQRARNALIPLAAAGYYLVTAPLGAQSARVVPEWVVLLLALVWVIGSPITAALLFAPKRTEPAPWWALPAPGRTERATHRTGTAVRQTEGAASRTGRAVRAEGSARRTGKRRGRSQLSHRHG